MSMETIATSHGIEIVVYPEALDPEYPNAFSRQFPYNITGNFWLSEDEPTYVASEAIISEAKARGASVADDSESSQMFLNGSTVADCVILTQVLKDQGRIPQSAILGIERSRTQATIAVSVTFKVNAEGDTADALIQQAIEVAMSCADHGSNCATGVSVEGATALVNREAIEGLF